MFAALITTNYVSNFNLVISKEISLGTIISTSNKFLAIFAALTNTTLKKAKLYKSNLFLFAANYQ